MYDDIEDDGPEALTSLDLLRLVYRNPTQPLSVRSTPQTRFKQHRKGRFPVERLSKDILQICFSVTIHPIESQK